MKIILSIALSILVLFSFERVGFAQNDTTTLKPQLIVPNTLQAHPFGLYYGRTSHNFKQSASNKIKLNFNLSNANVWMPKTTAYSPYDKSELEKVDHIIWHHKPVLYNVDSIPAAKRELEIDAVYRVYRFNVGVPLAKNQELQIGLRAFSIDGGTPPSSLITSDQFVEWFHSNVAGGEDPFGRKEAEYNQAYVRYVDFNGDSLIMKKGDFVLAGIDLTYSYFPTWSFAQNHDIFSHMDLNIGTNFSKANTGLDIGITATTSKNFKLNPKNQITFGASASALSIGIIESKTNIELINSPFLFSSEFVLTYTLLTKKKASWTVGINWWAQSSFIEPDKFDDFVLQGERTTTHWHLTTTHLYRPLSSNSIIFSYAKKNYSISVYLREDLTVDNAPDAQTGIEINYEF
ncbi:MAG: hypothetical protein ACPGEG_03515 [Salibacteraceae bacterium]